MANAIAAESLLVAIEHDIMECCNYLSEQDAVFSNSLQLSAVYKQIPLFLCAGSFR